ncbi:MAG: heat shock protein transcriptional repressor HspR [Actinomycetota bacterium]
MARRRSDHADALYVISIAAELAGVHPQTLRVYERKGLVQPHRTEGNTRRYSEEDIARLRKIQQLTQEGINLAGVMAIMELEADLQLMKDAYAALAGELERTRGEFHEFLEARDRNSLVPLRDVRRVRRAMKADLIDEAGRRRTFVMPPVDES